jgi:uncharacterized protein
MNAILPFVPLLASVAVTLVGLRFRVRSRGSLRSAWLAAGGTTVACSLADWLLLALLPRLNLSFGPLGPPLALFGLVRLGFLLLALPALFLARRAAQRTTVVWLAGVLQAALLLLSFYAQYIEPFRLGVTDLPVPAPAFLAGRPLRVLQLTDIHVEHPTRREQDMLDRAAALQPDLIVLTGDYVNPSYRYDPQTLQETRQILARLQAPYGVYAVNGTVDDPAIMSRLFDGLTNIRVLDDETVTLKFPGGNLALVGITTGNSLARDRKALQALMNGVDPADMSLLLYHSPDLIDAASAAGVDLFLAGHTHGGQIRLPFYGAVVTLTNHGKQYERGEYRVGPPRLYISRGIGMEGWFVPRMRFLCPPELVLVELGK